MLQPRRNSAEPSVGVASRLDGVVSKFTGTAILISWLMVLSSGLWGSILGFLIVSGLAASVLAGIIFGLAGAVLRLACVVVGGIICVLSVSEAMKDGGFSRMDGIVVWKMYIYALEPTYITPLFLYPVHRSVCASN